MNEEETKVEVTEAEEVKAEEVKTEENVVEETPVEEVKAEEAPAEEVKAEEAPAEEAKAEEAPAKEKKDLDMATIFAAVKKNIKWIAVGVAALILICVIAGVASNAGSSFTLTEEKTLYGQINSDTIMTLEGEEIVVDEGISTLSYSADNSLVVVKDKEDTLFVLDGTDLVEVATEVEYYDISAFGDSIAYVTDVEERIGTLYLYNVAKDTSVIVADEVLAGDVVISADGKSVAYVTDCEVEEDWFSYDVTGTVYVSKNGKEGKEIAKEATPLAVSDGGKYVFYIKGEDKLYVNEDKLATGIGSQVYFNQDCTELIFMEEDDTMYYAVKMKKPVKVKKGIFSGLYAPEEVVLASAYTADAEYRTSIYGVNSFNELLWCIDYCEAYYVYDKGEETEKISGYLTNYQMSPNGKSMLYSNGSQFIILEDFTKTGTENYVATGLTGYVSSFAASEDFKVIYFYNMEEEELCYLKKEEGVRITDDADSYVYSDKFGVVYFIEDDELFYATKNAKSVKKVCGETVTSLYVLDGEVYFVQSDDDTYSVNKITGKAKYETLFELDEEEMMDWTYWN